MNSTETIMAILLIGVALLLPGCTGSDDRLPARFRVSGKVTLDGEPISDGASIVFVSQTDAERGIQGSANIVAGRYEILLTPGKKLAKVSHVVETQPNVFKNVVPAKYNQNSTLEVEVSNQEQQLDFKLTTN